MTLTVLTTALIGCGGASRDDSAARTPPAPERRVASSGATLAALSAVRTAARKTLAAPAGVEFRLDGAQALGSSPAPVLGSGEFDFPSGVGSETIDLGETGGQERGNEQVLFMPALAYLQPKSPATAVLPKGKEWVSAALTGSESVNTNFPSFVLQVESVNPQLLLTELAGGAVSATPVGPMSIEGEPALGYEVTVDLTRALSASAAPGGAAVAQAIRSELSAPGSGQSAARRDTSITTWVGGGGRVVQVRASPPGAGVGTATMTMCCFGSPVQVAPPPAARVVDIASLTPSGERENNGGGDSDGG